MAFLKTEIFISVFFFAFFLLYPYFYSTFSKIISTYSNEIQMKIGRFLFMIDDVIKIKLIRET